MQKINLNNEPEFNKWIILKLVDGNDTVNQKEISQLEQKALEDKENFIEYQLVMFFNGINDFQNAITYRSVSYSRLAQISREITDSQIKVISRPSFRGYYDKVLYNLLDDYGVSLKQYYAGLSRAKQLDPTWLKAEA